MRRHDDDEAATVFGRIRDEVYDASKGGIFVAADGHSAWLQGKLGRLPAPLPRDVAAPRRRQYEVDPGPKGD